jgi:flagellar biosynthesis protein FlhB
MNDAAEKPFEPTPHRLAKAKREGNVARSGEFAANVSFAAAGATAIATAPLLGGVAWSVLVQPGSAVARPQSLLVLAAAMLPVGAAAAAGCAANALQGGGLTLKGIAPNFERLNIVLGLKRMLSRDTFAHAARAAVAFTCATLAMAPALASGAAAMLSAESLAGVVAAAWRAAQQVGVAAVAVGLVFSVGEYAAARSSWLRRLRMSFDERRREAKEEEGDPASRGRRRSLHRALLRSGLQRLKDAAFIVVNPEHVAVALEYRPPAVPVPRIVVRVVDGLALRVRRWAQRHDVPVVENGALARALYRDGRTGEPIPHAHYVAVAEVVAALLRSLDEST